MSRQLARVSVIPDAASPPSIQITPTSLTGGSQPRSSQPSFRSRPCHWPKAGILSHLFQSQAHSTHPQHTAPTRCLQSSPGPRNSSPAVLNQPCSSPSPSLLPLQLIQTQAHLCNSDSHGPCLSLIQSQFNPAIALAPVLNADPGQTPPRRHLACISYRYSPTCPKASRLNAPQVGPAGFNTGPPGLSQESSACIKDRTRSRLSQKQHKIWDSQ